MKNLVLLKDGEQYSGQYVAIKSFACRKVVSSGTDVITVKKEAQDKGCLDPVVFYVPEKEMVHVY